MLVRWIQIEDVASYVLDVCARETADVPQELLLHGVWQQKSISMAEIQADLSLLQRHDSNPVHVGRRDQFRQLILSHTPLLPLIVLRCQRGDRYLVDGYARYRALKSLGIAEAQVALQVIHG
jgi:hypothetical protein